MGRRKSRRILSELKTEDYLKRTEAEPKKKYRDCREKWRQKNIMKMIRCYKKKN